MRRIFLSLMLVFFIYGCAHNGVPGEAGYLADQPVSYVQVDDVDFAYRIYGKGRPLLMVMGFAGTMDIWDFELVQELADHHTVIIFDNRGAGGSSRGKEEVSIKNMADDCAGLLDALGYAQVDVLGWSMGGLIAQELALNHPHRVGKLVLMGTACDAEPVADVTRRLMKMDTKELLSHFFPKGWLEKYPDAIADLPRPSHPPVSSIIKEQADAMLGWAGCCSRLDRLENGVLIISGLDDDILPERLSLEIAERVKGAWLVRYKNATHWLMYQDPEGLGRTVSNFLDVKEDMLADH